MNLRAFLRAAMFALGNHCVAQIPSFRVRQAYYRRVLGYSLGQGCCIHMGCFFTGDCVEIGPNTILNRRCYIDGRLGVTIGANCSLSPEVYILSMDHDPQSPVSVSLQASKTPIRLRSELSTSPKVYYLPPRGSAPDVLKGGG